MYGSSDFLVGREAQARKEEAFKNEVVERVFAQTLITGIRRSNRFAPDCAPLPLRSAGDCVEKSWCGLSLGGKLAQ
jgi:hypothetical protein